MLDLHYMPDTFRDSTALIFKGNKIMSGGENIHRKTKQNNTAHVQSRS